MAVGTWQMDYLMVMGMEQTGIRSMAVGAMVITWASRIHTRTSKK